jgi:1-deoxy-D-xylulose-5-phosphate reductoisomerase
MNAAMSAKRKIVILGATGSIGASALDVIARHPGRFDVVALAANRRWEAMLGLVRRFRPLCAALADAAAARELAAAVRCEGLSTRVLSGADGVVEAASLPGADTVIAAIVGAAGLNPTIAAARGGKRVLLANKEALVLAGGVFMRAVREGGGMLLPIDSEHNAVFQCLPWTAEHAREAAGVRRILLTASGGPFRTRTSSDLERVTPDEACAHPRWRMGRKISVDSATMMNKGLEVIEAHWLFGCAPEQIEVVIHPESIVHSLVEYVDGSVLAQLSHPDMRTPLAQALAWPERVNAGVAPLDLAQVGALNFAAPDRARFPCLDLAYQALAAGGTAPAVLNAANEVAVSAFLERRLGFLDISGVCAATLGGLPVGRIDALEDALEADRAARAFATRVLEKHALHV